MTQEPSRGEASRPRLTVGWGAGTCLVAAGWLIGLRSLTDNSFFTHLATGRLILEGGSVPSADPYTFTAHGEPWVVQSWLASVLYGTAEAVAGANGLRVLMGLLAASLTALAWRITRPASSLIIRLGLGVVFVAASAGLWSERPFMLGLLALAAVVVAAEGELDPRWLVPVAWIWVNVHGSFPIGLAYLVVVAVGRRLDGGSPIHELRALRWLAAGVVLGAVGPLGPRVLVFPVELLQRQDLLSNVIEWQAPTFDSFSQRVFVVQLMLAVVLLVRRPSYRVGLVIATFGAAALLGVRNLPVAALLILPGMAWCAPAVGSLRSGDRSRIGLYLAAAGLFVGLLVGASRLDEPDFEVARYPVDAIAYLEAEEVDLERIRMAAPDIVGNYLELVYGAGHTVFYDDRFDMFPSAVSEANLSIVRSEPSLSAVLERYEIDLVTWERAAVTGQRLIVDPGWRVLFSDPRWIVVCRRGSDLGGRLARC